MREPTVAFVGLAHTHPWFDAPCLRRAGARLSGVWDPDAADRSAFARRFDIPEFEELSALLADEPDVAVVTVPPIAAPPVARTLARRGIASFFNKTVGVNMASFDAWSCSGDAPRTTSSVLRFAPAIIDLGWQLRTRRVHSIDIFVHHDIRPYLKPSRRWQDDPEGAGGTLMNVGIHAWEILDVLRPGVRVRIDHAWRTDGGVATLSELAAGGIGSDVDSETSVSVTVSGTPGPQRFHVRAITDHGVAELTVAGHPADLGFDGISAAILRLARTRRDLADPSRVRSVYANAFTLAVSARAVPQRFA
ncbi:Gfo/Idh/MocA family oxidoreductase [Microbacterium sp. ABRD28]|uniref:Gfo/Idh/MocA family oxidoreductase n=1 Tax=Microbacterium sp. ABRD28 TaxID=2268461 RepID=UPI000F554F3C|nr:Gfo/Idh/MocA family oxidoreductase [Microbacterium sp. ABRD28]AZC14014.1 hypothetical protein DT073_10075 [Microbacterium sp. ABRD28]